MEKRSKHYEDVAKWVEKVIDSCETYQQTFTVNKLIKNFRIQLIKNNPTKFESFIYPLENMLFNKKRSLVETLKK